MGRCHNRDESSEDDPELHLVDSLIPPYMPNKQDGAPRVTMSSAIQLVNRYSYITRLSRE